MTGRIFAVLLGCLLLATAARAGTFTTPYLFCGQTGCPDGDIDDTGLSQDAAGNLYGVTHYGTTDNNVIFRLSPDGSGGWTYSVLYRFCPTNTPICKEGASPDSGVIVGSDGSLYGTTYVGGKNIFGIVYRLSSQGGDRWKLDPLHYFCSEGGGCPTGMHAHSGLSYVGQGSGALYDGISPLYGLAEGGAYGKGLVFSLTPPGAGKAKWRYEVLHSFCSDGGNCLADGSNPRGLFAHSQDTLYGTAWYGGAYGGGAAFALNRPAKDWSASLLYSFCRKAKAGCPDGKVPDRLIEDSQGKLVGMTLQGGRKHRGCGRINRAGCGTLFQLDPASKAFTTLHVFCIAPSCPDGSFPSGLILTGSGDIIGTAGGGGAHGNGVLYRLNGGALSVLYDFCTQTRCADGALPEGALAVDPLGRIFGTTFVGGGASYQGVIYEYEP